LLPARQQFGFVFTPKAFPTIRPGKTSLVSLFLSGHEGIESDNMEKRQTAVGQIPQGRLAYSMRETAAILGVSYITVHRLLKRGLLRSCGVLRHKLIPVVEIERFLRETME
jgi:hypothetical protein